MFLLVRFSTAQYLVLSLQCWKPPRCFSGAWAIWSRVDFLPKIKKELTLNKGVGYKGTVKTRKIKLLQYEV